MLLTEKVYFKAQLDSANRLQIPNCVRLRFKLEKDQYLKVRTSLGGLLIRPTIAKISKTMCRYSNSIVRC
jgi:hypothetical protein